MKGWAAKGFEDSHDAGPGMGANPAVRHLATEVQKRPSLQYKWHVLPTYSLTHSLICTSDQRATRTVDSVIWGLLWVMDDTRRSLVVLALKVSTVAMSV